MTAGDSLFFDVVGNIDLWKFIYEKVEVSARTKNALLFGYKKWLALARHTFVRM